MMPPDQAPAFLGGHPDPADLALYAMQLAAGDQATLAEHLARCPECRAELARTHSDLAIAALAVDLESPSAAARTRLLAQVVREPKIAAPPAAAPVAATQTQAQPRPQPQLRPVLTFGSSSSTSSSGPARSSGSAIAIDDHPPKSRIGLAIFAGVGWAAAAALLIAAAAIERDRQSMRSDLTAEAGLIRRLNTDAASAHQLMDALTDPGAQRVTLTLTGTPRPKGLPIGGVTYNPDKGSLVFIASDLNPLEQYKAYELWIIPADNSAPIPVGTFHPDQQGNASILLPDLPKSVPAKAFGITVEPDGGSQTPTMPLFMFGA